MKYLRYIDFWDNFDLELYKRIVELKNKRNENLLLLPKR